MQNLGESQDLAEVASDFLFLVKSLGKNWAVFIGVSQMSNDCSLVNYDVYIMYSSC